MAKPLTLSKLGRQQLNFAKSINLDTFPVRVKRQDSTIENVMLMAEMVAFLDKEMPNTVDNYIVRFPRPTPRTSEVRRGTCLTTTWPSLRPLSITRWPSNKSMVSQRRHELGSQGQLKADQDTESRS